MADIRRQVVVPANILDPALRGYKCSLLEKQTRLKGYDVARSYNGFFCYTFRFVNGSDTKGLRIWKSPEWVHTNGLDARFRKISAFLDAHSRELPYFVKFAYLDRALLDADGSAFPGMRIDWVNGRELGTWLTKGNEGADRRPTRAEIGRVASEFMNMCRALRALNVSHGDLSNKNIFVTPLGEIRLVDYDSLYVPPLGALPVTTTGCRGFQHPRRFTTAGLKSGPGDDNFSQQVIYLTLLVLSQSEQLYLEYDDFDNELLFDGMEFESQAAFDSCPPVQAIRRAFPAGHEAVLRLDELRRSIALPLGRIPSILDFRRPEPPKPRPQPQPQPAAPQERYVEFCTQCGAKYRRSTDRYCNICCHQREKYQ